MADIGRDDNIWPEMDFLNVLEWFCTKNQYKNLFRSFLRNSKKSIFLKFLFVGFGHFGGGRIFYGSGIVQKTTGTCLFDSCPFPKKMTPIKSGYLQNAIEIRILASFPHIGIYSYLSDLLN